MGPETKNLRGALLVILAMFCFVSNDGFLKALTGLLEWHQVVFLRGLVGTVFLFFLALFVHGPRSPRQLLGYLRHWPCALRVVFDVLATCIWVLALLNMPLAPATTINQAMVVILTLGGALFFKETLGWRRLAAAGVGLVGTLLIIKPGTEGFTPVSLVALLATLMMAARELVTRALRQEVPSVYVAALSMAAITLFGGLATLSADWPPLGPEILLKALGAGVFLALAFVFVVMGTRIGEVSFLAPFRYASLVGGLLIAVIVFGERPDRWSLLGATLIVASGLYILHRERRLGFQAPSAGSTRRSVAE